MYRGLQVTLENTELDTDSKSTHSTHLTLRTTRLSSFQSAAEIDSTFLGYQHLSARFYARVVGSSGACAGIFTWYCPGLCRSASSTEVEEADIEILTSDPAESIHFTNQPSESPLGFTYENATLNASLPKSAIRGDWNEYRYDWLPGLSAWYVNGESVANISFQTPEQPAQLIINMWSNGGSWSGNMSIGDAAYLNIQWIEIAYNTSSVSTKSPRGLRTRSLFEPGYEYHEDTSYKLNKRHSLQPRESKTQNCKRVCKIDSTNSVGVPIASGGTNRQVGSCLLLVIILVICTTI